MKGKDPFDRAVQREAELRKGALDQPVPHAVLGLVTLMRLAMVGGWGALVVLHRLLAPQPRLLLVVHVLAFALYAGYSLVSLLFLLFMTRRLPWLRHSRVRDAG